MWVLQGSCGVVDQVVGPDGYLYFVDLQGRSRGRCGIVG